jgi:hypothetical protein
VWRRGVKVRFLGFYSLEEKSTEAKRKPAAAPMARKM